MVIKTDLVPDPTGQQPINSPPKSHSTLPCRPVWTLAANASQVFLVLFAVLSGMTGEPEILEEMGIYLGPTHL